MSKLVEKANAIITNHHFEKVQDPKPLYINNLTLPKNVTFTYFRDTLTLYDHKGNPYGTIYRYTNKDLPISAETSQTHAAKDAPDFNRGRNWRTTWGK